MQAKDQALAIKFEMVLAQALAIKEGGLPREHASRVDLANQLATAQAEQGEMIREMKKVHVELKRVHTELGKRQNTETSMALELQRVHTESDRMTQKLAKLYTENDLKDEQLVRMKCRLGQIEQESSHKDS